MSHMTVTIATGSALSLLLGSTWIHQAPTHSTRPRLSVSEGGRVMVILCCHHGNRFRFRRCSDSTSRSVQ